MYVQISSGYVLGQDTLTLTGVHPTITTSWNATEGKLTLSGVSGNPTYLEFTAAIEAIVFSNTSINPNGQRVFSITVGQANYLESTDHYYQYIPNTGISWLNAKNAAASSTYYGLQGYLATITSMDEVQISGIQASGAGWIGGTDEETEGVWKWASGPEAGTIFWNGGINGSTPNFSFWNTNEPNNQGEEDYAHVTAPGVGQPGSWNDLSLTGATSGNYQPKGYIVEYGGMPGDPVLHISTTATITIPQITSFTNASNCGNGAVTLQASANIGNVNWYANSTGGTSLQSNTTNPSSFTTPSINATTSYYVEQQYNAGLGVGTNTGNVTTTGVGVAFNVHTAFTLNSLVIRTRKSSNADGSLTVLIKNSIGTVVSTHNLVVPGVSGNNNNVTYNIGYAFSPGIYTMEVSAMSANISRVYFTAGVAYPLNYGVVSFTGNVGNGAGSYNYFYDWNISLPRQEVVATIGSNVTPSVSITSSDADNSICSGTSVTFTATPVNGGSAPSYQWKLNGANVGTNSATYSNSTLANNDVVTVVMTANNACQTASTANGNSITTAVTNTVSPSVSMVSDDADNFVCNGTSVTFTATATNGGSAPTYQWKVIDAGVETFFAIPSSVPPFLRKLSRVALN